MIKRIRLASDEDWRKRPMTEGMFLTFVVLGVAVLLLGISEHGNLVMAAGGGLVMAVSAYARFRTLRAVQRGKEVQE